MKVTTYGIFGLTEWHGNIKAGSISVKVSFVGGTASPTGAQPAYFTTSDPITQFVIENSNEFKNGLIHIEMSQDTPGAHHRMAVKKQVEKPAAEAVVVDAPKEETGELTVVDAPDKEWAADWLIENHPEKNYTHTKLRTYDMINAAAAECGVRFNFSK